MLARTALLTLSAAALATAQLGSLTDGLSTSCTSAATSLITSDLATCASVGNLLSLFTSSGSVVTPINTWLGALCSTSNCTDASISNATSTLKAGCSAELSAGQSLVETVVTLVENFNAVKEGVCLESTSNSTFCITNLLTDLQNATSTDITFSTLTNLNTTSLSSIPSSTVCTDCSHALISKLGPIFGTNSSSSITGAITDVCGSSFTDGVVPSTVSESTGTNSTKDSGSVTSSNLSGAQALVVGGGAAMKVLGAAAIAAMGLAVLV